ncbi:MAG TPA: hypothetical protein P5572_18730 [Phycisphaerae bacterium]|nr:hypothetical protein [Phycisphaerae bacterium]
MNARNRSVFGLLGLVVAAAGLAGCPSAPPDDNSIPATNQRVAFQSQCALNVVECTTSWPTAVASVVAGDGQAVTANSNGYRVVVYGGSGGVPVSFRGADSIAGNGATTLEHHWSYGATDADPCTLAPGTEVSTAVNPTLELAEGFHYIRLFVINNVLRDEVIGDGCGVVATDTGSFDFVELEVEVLRQ